LGPAGILYERRAFSCRVYGFDVGQFRYPSAQVAEEAENSIVEGSARGDITWWRFRRVASIGTMVEFEYAADTAAFDFNNKLKLSVGMVLKTAIAGGGYRVRWQVGGRSPACNEPYCERFHRLPHVVGLMAVSLDPTQLGPVTG